MSDYFKSFDRKLCVGLLLSIFIGLSSVANARLINAKHTDTLIIEGTSDFPPFSYLDDNGNPSGFEVDLTKAILKKLKISKYIIRLDRWGNVYNDLLSGSSDIVMGMAYTKSRASMFKYGGILADARTDVVYRRGSKPVKSVSNLAGKRVFAKRNSSNYELLKDAGYSDNIISVENAADALKLLSKGEGDAFVCEHEMAVYTIYKLGIKNLAASDLGLPPVKLKYVFSNDDFVDDFEWAVYELKKDGSYQVLYDSWFGSKDTRLKKYSISLIFVLCFIVFSAAVFIVFIVLLNRKLKKTLKIKSLKNDQLRILVSASNIDVFRFSVKEQKFYNIEGDHFSPIGKSFATSLSQLHPDDIADFRQMFQDLSDGKKSFGSLSFRMNYLCDGKTWTYVKSVYAAEKDDEGIVYEILGTFEDATPAYLEKKAAEENLRKIHYSLDAAGMVLWSYTVSDSMLRTYNDPLTGYDDNVQIDMDTYLQKANQDDVAAAYPILEKLRAGVDGNFSIQMRFHYPKKAGWRTCTIAVEPFEMEEDGTVKKYVGFRSDNTEELEVNSELNLYVLRLDYVLKMCNLRLWEYKKEENKFVFYSGARRIHNIASRDEILSCMEPYERKRVDALFDRMKEGSEGIFSENLKMNFSAIYNNGTEGYINYTGMPVKDGDEVKYFGLRRDVTETVEFQMNLKKQMEKAQQADELKSKFLANMSHEIRTPLNAIVGFSNILLAADDEESRKEYVDLINTNSELLLRLVNDILDLSKIEAGVVQISAGEYDMALSFDDIMASLKDRVKPDVDLIIENPYTECFIIADSSRVAQILVNFVTNAAKYTSSGYIKASYTYTDGGLKIVVEDTGIGIPDEKKHLVFQRFEKLDNFAKGNGLGLSICKAIIDYCKGKIGFESVEGKGSTFWAWFPCPLVKIELKSEDADAVTAEPPVKTSTKISDKITSDDYRCMFNSRTCTLIPGRRSCEILVAEDNNSNFMLVPAMLRCCKLDRAENGKIAVEKAQARKYDVILMDMKMPVMNGLDAIKEIRRLGIKTPIITLTAFAFDEDRVAAEEAGSNGFLTKPVNASDLREAIAGFVKES